MKHKADPNLRREITKFGGKDISLCMNCGNCTATCALASNGSNFPRRIIHSLQVGLTDEVLGSLDPWLCYYCGDCSESCPRDANPGEAMMATRRYLTAKYDWTGLSKKLYLSTKWEIFSVMAVSFLVLGLFYFLHGPMITSQVELNTFAPVKWVELGDWLMAAILSFFLLSNAYRLFRFSMRDMRGRKIPLSLYLKAFPDFFSHFATQRRWRDCGTANVRWFKHLLLVSGYLTMLVMIVGFLPWFQTDKIHPFWHPQRLLGYYATVVLLYVTVDFMVGRYKKLGQIHKFSEPSDWIFLGLLFLTTLSGILVHGFRINGYPLATYYTYVIHLAVLVPMLVIEVPFGKWAHLLYRPLAIYLEQVKRNAPALETQQKKAA